MSGPCVALKVVCLARDAEALRELKRAAVGSEWELTPGATSLEEALEQIATFRAHVLVAAVDAPDLVERVRSTHPGLRMVLVRAGGEGAPDPLTVTVHGMDGVRAAITGRST